MRDDISGATQIGTIFETCWVYSIGIVEALLDRV